MVKRKSRNGTGVKLVTAYRLVLIWADSFVSTRLAKNGRCVLSVSVSDFHIIVQKDSQRSEQDSRSFVSRTQAGISRPRITAESLRMELRPPEPVDWDARMTPAADYGRQYWTGWVCGVCGCASERKKWYGWTCESCGVSPKILPHTHVTDHSASTVPKALGVQRRKSSRSATTRLDRTQAR